MLAPEPRSITRLRSLDSQSRVQVYQPRRVYFAGWIDADGKKVL